MVDEIKVLIVKPNRKSLKIAAAVIIGLLIIGLIILRFRKITSAPSQSTQPRPISHQLDSCAVTKEENPLVESLSTQANTIQGTYKGRVTDLALDSIRKSYLIKLSSLDEKQTFSFNIKEQKGLFFTAKGEASGSALRTTQTLQISFTCNNNTKLLNFTKILIL